jgi:hypothetical protein
MRNTHNYNDNALAVYAINNPIIAHPNAKMVGLTL